MKSLVIVAAVICLFAANSPVQSDETFEIVADSTLDGNPGFILRITDPGYPGFNLFVFEESEKIRFYAGREDGEPGWTVFSGFQYLCPSTTMNVSDSWRFLDDEVEETIATVVALEPVTTNAGTFPSYKVNIAHASNPTEVISIMWFSSGFGIVKQWDYFPEIWRSDLQEYSLVGGSGFFPLTLGNRWDYAEIQVPVEESTWGAIKALYE